MYVVSEKIIFCDNDWKPCKDIGNLFISSIIWTFLINRLFFLSDADEFENICLLNFVYLRNCHSWWYLKALPHGSCPGVATCPNPSLEREFFQPIKSLYAFHEGGKWRIVIWWEPPSQTITLTTLVGCIVINFDVCGRESQILVLVIVCSRPLISSGGCNNQ